MVQGRRRRVVAMLIVALATTAGVGVAPASVSAAAPPCKVVNVRTGASTAKLQVALDKAAAGDTLRITGTCKGSFTVGSGYAKSRKLTLVRGATSADLQGTGGSVLKVVGGTIAITGLRITGGDGVGCSTYGGTPDVACGGGIWNAARLTLTKVTVTGNRAGQTGAQFRRGGGIFNDGAGVLRLVRSTVSGNLAAEGGGIANDGGTVTIVRSTIAANTASIADGPARGGGIYSYGTLSLDRSTVRDNEANSAVEATGAGIYAWGPGMIITILRSTVSGNQASGSAAVFGGGIYGTDGSTIKVIRSTISGNSAEDNSRGGGIYSDATLIIKTSTISGNRAAGEHGGVSVSGNTTISFSTITGNTGGFVGGVGVNGTLTLQSSIVAGNTTIETDNRKDCLAGTVVADHSVVGAANGCGTLTDGDNFNQAGLASDLLDPVLGPLAKNGGPTKTHALLVGSPAIGTGGTCAKTTDQRGSVRPSPKGGACDVGAYERS